MMDIDIKGDGRYASSRRAAYKYSIDSWKKWCDKNDCELFVLTDLLLPQEEMAICWQRYYLFDILDANGIKYDQILSVDAADIDIINGTNQGITNESPIIPTLKSNSSQIPAPIAK